MTAPLVCEVRRLVEGDWAALRATRLAALAEAPWAFASTLERELGFSEQGWRERLTTGPAAYFGAEEPGPGPEPEPEPGPAQANDPRPLAVVAALLRRDQDWHLVSMWVSPRARGTGLARRLVDAVCDLAGADGAARVDLWVTLVNERARAFYLKAGFLATGDTQPVRPDEPDHLEERMSRPVS